MPKRTKQLDDDKLVPFPKAGPDAFVRAGDLAMQPEDNEQLAHNLAAAPHRAEIEKAAEQILEAQEGFVMMQEAQLKPEARSRANLVFEGLGVAFRVGETVVATFIPRIEPAEKAAELLTCVNAIRARHNAKIASN